MLRLAVFLTCFIPTLAFAGPPAGSQIDGWTVTYWHTWWWYAPPAKCTTGPLPEYRVVTESQSNMDKMFMRKGTQFEHMFGYSLPTPDGFWLIWVAAGLPGPVHRGLIEHEKAHMRGCEHPDM